MNILYFLQWSNRCCARIKSAKCSFYLLKAFGSLQMICGLILDKAEPAETIIQFWYWIIYQEKFSFVQILWFYQIRSQYHIIIRDLWFFEFSLDIAFFFFEDFEIYSGRWPLSVSPRCQWVCTMTGQKPVLQQQNLQNSEKSKHFKEKHNI